MNVTTDPQNNFPLKLGSEPMAEHWPSWKTKPKSNPQRHGLRVTQRAKLLSSLGMGFAHLLNCRQAFTSMLWQRCASPSPEINSIYFKKSSFLNPTTMYLLTPKSTSVVDVRKEEWKTLRGTAVCRLMILSDTKITKTVHRNPESICWIRASYWNIQSQSLG